MEQETDTYTYRHAMPIQIRFADVDRYGHVNNNAYFSYYDLGKMDYLSTVLGLYAQGTEQDVVPVVANIQADFFQPVFYGDDIVVETCIPHLGEKSFTLRQRAVNRGTGAVVCQCTTVMVCFSLKQRHSVELPLAFREAITRYERGEG